MNMYVMTIATVAASLVILVSSGAAAEDVPAWIKTNAALWVGGDIDDQTFVNGIRYLAINGIITIPGENESVQESDVIPVWIKETAGLWVDGLLTDNDFINSMQYLVGAGIIRIGPVSDGPDTSDIQTTSADPVLAGLHADLEACSEIKKAYKRLDCQDAVEDAILVHGYKQETSPIHVGPISYYWYGMGSEGNALETSGSGKHLLSIRMLAENTSNERVSLKCTSPQICNYDITDGSMNFKYSGMDFTNGQIVLDPGQAREFNMLFGPNIGYGGTEFVYDPAKTYHFRIFEDYGSVQIPLIFQ